MIIRFGLPMLIFCLLLTAGTVLVGRAQPLAIPFDEIGVQWCEDILCFKGIRPGVTTWGDIAAYTKGGLYITDSIIRVEQRNLEVSFIAEASESTSPIRIVSIKPLGPRLPTLGELMMILGTPKFIEGMKPYVYVGRFSIHFATLTAYVSVLDRLSIDTPIELLLFHEGGVHNPKTCDSLRWHGLTTVVRYEALRVSGQEPDCVLPLN